MKTHEIYQYVTDTIISLLETHMEDWNKPWISFGQDTDYARNPSSSRYYRGINQFLLSFALIHKGYFKNVWMTFNQIKDMEGFVKKDEKSLPVIFYKSAFIDKSNRYYAPETVSEMGTEKAHSLGIQNVPIIKLYHVFNVAQTEGLNEEFYHIEPQGELTSFEKDEAAENLIKSTGAAIEITESNRAYYNPVRDKIMLPLREQFKGEAEPFYATALHELGHWTGHETRLNRKGGTVFGDAEYAKEELVAELTSAFCCAHLGFSKNITNNAAYIRNWLTILKKDNKAVVSAAADAQRAADYIIGGPEYTAYQKD